MIHIFLTILKIIGIFLLVVLGILLLAILSVLFVPLTYRGKASKKEKGLQCLLAEGSVGWLLGVLSIRFRYQNQNMTTTVCIFGIPLEQYKKAFQWIRRTSPAKKGAGGPENGPAPEPEKKREMAVPLEERDAFPPAEPVKEEEPAPLADIQETPVEKAAEPEQTEQPEGKHLLWALSEVFRTLPELLLEGVRRLLFGALWVLELPFRLFWRLDRVAAARRRFSASVRYWKRILRSETFRTALAHSWREVVLLLRHLAPGRVEGGLCFGFDDPSLTGQALGLISIFWSRLPEKLQITPCFEEAILRFEVSCRGRLYGVVLLGIAWRMFRDRNFRSVIAKFQKKEAK